MLSELAKRSKRQEIFSTFVIWGVVAPFSYVFKQLDEDGHEKWMPWIYDMVKRILERLHMDV